MKIASPYGRPWVALVMIAKVGHGGKDICEMARLTGLRAEHYNLYAFFTVEGDDDEAHISAQPTTPPQGPWLSQAHADGERPQGPASPQTARPQAHLGLTGVLDETLRHRVAVQEVFQRGRRFSDQRIAVYVLPSEAGRRRCAVAAGKKLGNAVVRNRARRRLREAYRQERKEYLPGCDIVLLARTDALTASYGEICSSIRTLFARGEAWVNGGARSRASQ